MNFSLDQSSESKKAEKDVNFVIFDWLNVSTHHNTYQKKLNATLSSKKCVKRTAQFSSNMQGIISNTLEENLFNKTLATIHSFLSSNRFPPALMVHSVMKDILVNSTCTAVANRAYCLLQHLLYLHPPSVNRNLYQTALKSPLQDNVADTQMMGTIWEFVRWPIRLLLGLDCTMNHEQTQQQGAFNGAENELDFRENQLKVHVYQSLMGIVALFIRKQHSSDSFLTRHHICFASCHEQFESGEKQGGDYFHLMEIMRIQKKNKKGANLEGSFLLLKFLVLLMERDLSAYIGPNREASSNNCPLVWTMFWQCGSGVGANCEVRELIKLSWTSIRIAQRDGKKVEVVHLLQSLVAMAAQCCRNADKSDGLVIGDRAESIAVEIAMKYSKNDTDSGCLKLLLETCRPMWLRLRVSELLLQNHYDDCLVPEENRFLLSSPISVAKIVGCYFFLLPKQMNEDKRKSCFDVTTAAAVKNSIRRVQPLQVIGDSDGPQGLPNYEDEKKAKKGGINRRNIRGAQLLEAKQADGCRPVDIAVSEDMRQYLSDQTNGRQTQICNVENSTLDSNSPEVLVNCKDEKKAKKGGINRRNIRGETKLHTACIKNDSTLVRQLLSDGADANITDYAGWTPLHEACNWGNTQCVQEILAARRVVLGSDKVTGVSGDKLVDLLAAPQDGTTPLHDAASNGHVDVAKVLIEAGGARLLEAKQADGCQPVDIAGSEDMRQYLSDQTNGRQTQICNVENSTLDSNSPEVLVNCKDEKKAKKGVINRRNIRGNRLLEEKQASGCRPVDFAESKKMRQYLSEITTYFETRICNLENSTLDPNSPEGHVNCTDEKKTKKVGINKRNIRGTGLLEEKQASGCRPVDIAVSKKMRQYLSEITAYFETQISKVENSTLDPNSPEVHVNCTDEKKTKKVGINKRNIRGETKLHTACIKNNSTLVRQLLSDGADANITDYAGWTPLHEACNWGNTQCVQEILAARRVVLGSDKVTGLSGDKLVDLLAAPQDGTTPLHDAASNGHVAVAKLLIEAGGALLLEAKQADGCRPVDIAGSEDMRQYLSDQTNGRQTQICNVENSTLDLTSPEVHLNCKDEKKAKKGGINRRNIRGARLLKTKEVNGCKPVDISGIKEMRQYLSDQTNCLPTQNCDVENSILDPNSPEVLVKCKDKKKPKKVGINKRNIRGETKLHTACIKNDSTLVRQLLSDGADANIKDYAGWTPLHEACNWGNTQCVQEILAARRVVLGSDKVTGLSGDKLVDLLASPQDGTTPLHDAASNGHVAVAKLLIEAGGTRLLEAKQADGCRPVDIAGSKGMRQYLSDQYEIYNAKNSTLSTAIIKLSSDKLNLARPTEEMYKNVLPQKGRRKHGEVCVQHCEELLLVLSHLLQVYVHLRQLSADCRDGDCAENNMRNNDLSYWRDFKSHAENLKSHITRISQGRDPSPLSCVRLAAMCAMH